MKLQRRDLLLLAPLAAIKLLPAQSTALARPISTSFPTQPAELAKEMVGVSHGNAKRVAELLKAQPALAKASWDWGFGDWETALGAASHTGRRDIALLLLESGAPPTLFSATMLGQLDVVKALIAAQPGTQRLPGPHSISLLAHAKAGGEDAKAVYDFLNSLGDAGDLPSVPITPEQLTSVTGTYTFGAAAHERIAIELVRGQLQFTRVGTDARRLTHLGDLAFHPAGSRAVRIRFDGKGLMTVSDPDIVLTAKKA